MDDIIDRGSDEFRELIGSIETAIAKIEQVSAHLKPPICNERYLTGEEICRIFHISKRTLQTLRDNGTLAYTKIGNRTYYLPEDVERIVTKVEDRRKDARYRGHTI